MGSELCPRWTFVHSVIFVFTKVGLRVLTRCRVSVVPAAPAVPAAGYRLDMHPAGRVRKRCPSQGRLVVRSWDGVTVGWPWGDRGVSAGWPWGECGAPAALATQRPLCAAAFSRLLREGHDAETIPQGVCKGDLDHNNAQGNRGVLLRYLWLGHPLFKTHI